MNSPFRIDELASDSQYLFVDIPSKGITLCVKLDDEGIVVDLFPLDVVHKPVASLWATYAEFTGE